MNEDDVKLDGNIKVDEFKNGLKEYKEKYKTEKVKEINDLLSKKDTKEEDVDKVYKLLKNFEEYFNEMDKDNENNKDNINNLKEEIKNKKKGLIIKQISELLKTKGKKEEDIEQNRKSVKEIIKTFKQVYSEDAEIVKEVEEEIYKEIEKIVDDYLKTDEGKAPEDIANDMRDAHGIFEEIKDELTEEQREKIEKNFNEVEKVLFDKKVEKQQQNKDDKDKKRKENLEKKIEYLEKEIETIKNITKDENRKRIEREINKLEKKVKHFNEGKKKEEQIDKIKIEKEDKNQKEITVYDLKIQLYDLIIEDINNSINNGLLPNNRKDFLEKEKKLRQQEEEEKNEQKENEKDGSKEVKTKNKSEQSILKQINSLKDKIQKLENKEDELNKKIEYVELELNKAIYSEEKRRIEEKVKTINNTNEHIKHCDNMESIRKLMLEEDKILDEKNKNNLKEAKKYLSELIKLKKDADKHDENTRDDKYKEEQLNGYNESGTTNIQNNLLGKIKHIRDSIFKTDRELLEKRKKDITEKCENSKQNLNSIKLDEITDDTRENIANKINNAFDLLHDFSKLLGDIENVNKLIKDYNEVGGLTEDEKEKELDEFKNGVNKSYEELKNLFQEVFKGVNRIIKVEFDKMKKNKENKENKKNKNEYESVNYKLLKNVCLVVLEILEHKFSGKGAGYGVLTQTEQEEYVEVCMILGYINSLPEKETGVKENSVQSFKYYTKALKLLKDEGLKGYINSEKDKKTQKEKKIIQCLIGGGILQNVEKEIKKAGKSLKKTDREIKERIKTLESDIESVVKTKGKSKENSDIIDNILELGIVKLSDDIQEKNNELPKKNGEMSQETPGEPLSATADNSTTSTVGVGNIPSAPPPPPLNNGSTTTPPPPPPPPLELPLVNKGKPLTPNVNGVPKMSNAENDVQQPNGGVSGGNSNENTNTKDPSVNEAEVKNEQEVDANNVNKNKNAQDQTSESSTSSKKDDEEQKKEISNAQDKKQTSKDANKTMVVGNTGEKSYNNVSSILENGPKPIAANGVSDVDRNMKGKQGGRDEQRDEVKQQGKKENKQIQTTTNKQNTIQQTQKITNKQDTSKQITNRSSSSQLSFMIMMMVFDQMLNSGQQNKKLNVFNSMFNPPYFGNNFMNNMFNYNPYSSYFRNNLMNNMFNNLNSTLNAFNSFGRFGNQKYF